MNKGSVRAARRRQQTSGPFTDAPNEVTDLIAAESRRGVMPQGCSCAGQCATLAQLDGDEVGDDSDD